MINHGIVKQAFRGVVSFRDDLNPLYNLTGINAQPESGKYYNEGVHPYVTARNLEAMMPFDFTPVTWSVSTTYDTGAIVERSGKYYEAKRSGVGKDPVTEPTYWIEVSLLAAWLRRMVDSVIDKAIYDTYQGKPLVDHALLYSVERGELIDTKQNNFVGFEIRPRNSENIRLIINRVAFQGTSDETLTVYLRNQNTVVGQWDISGSAGELAWSEIEGKITGQGRWFLYYDQAQHTGEAYNGNITPAGQVSPYVSVYSFKIPNTSTDFLRDVSSFANETHGLGLDISLDCDLTQFYVSNRLAFADVLQRQFEYNALEMFFYNPEARSNLKDRNINMEAVLAELKSDTPYSVVSRLSRAYTKLRKSLNFGDVCLPCSENSAISYSSYG
jgi:hypothetical protein